MSPVSHHRDGRTRGPITLAATFVFVFLFRLEQNVAYVLGLSSARRLVEIEVFPIELSVHVLAPFLHVTPNHLVGTLIWFVPFGYFLERRTSREDYVGFVLLAGYVTTTFVPLVFLFSGIPVGQGIGASGITHALIAREVTARGSLALQRHSFSWGQRAILVIAVGSFLVKLVAVLNGSSPGESVVAHAAGLTLGVLAGVGERYVSLSDVS